MDAGAAPLKLISCSDGGRERSPEQNGDKDHVDCDVDGMVMVCPIESELGLTEGVRNGYEYASTVGDTCEPGASG